MLLEVLLKSSIIWGGWWLVYVLFFSKNVQFSIRRLYLYLAILSGVIIPWITSPWEIFSRQELAAYQVTATFNTTAPIAEQNNNNLTTPTEGFPLMEIIVSLYLLGICFILWKTIREVRFLYMCKRTAEKVEGNVYYSSYIKSPLSFHNNIYIPAEHSYTTEEMELILQHEKVHISNHHGVDRWVVQVWCTLLWFHPMPWLYKRLFITVHENEADYNTAKDNPYKYGQLLLKVAGINPSLALRKN